MPTIKKRHKKDNTISIILHDKVRHFTP